jgi:hypothetical protein
VRTPRSSTELPASPHNGFVPGAGFADAGFADKVKSAAM